jgi:hypothetical protein
MFNSKENSKCFLYIFVFNWIFGIGIIQYPLGKPRPIISFFYSLIHLIIYCSFSAITYTDIIEISDLSQVTMPRQILYLSHVFLSISTICLGWYRNKVRVSETTQINSY